MNNTIYAFLLSSLAGLSTLIGTIIIFFKHKNINSIIAKSLYFAAGVMITVSITDLIPESFKILTSKFYLFPSILILLIFLSIGVIFSLLIDKYLPDNESNIKNKGLYRVGIISMLAIILHNIPEGIATFISSNTSIGLSLVIAISCHNIPEGISISVPIYYATKSKLKSFVYTFISAISEPFGALLAFLFLSNFNTDNIMGYLFAFIAGIMLHISFYELIPTSHNYKAKNSIYYLIIGSLAMYLNHIIFN